MLLNNIMPVYLKGKVGLRDHETNRSIIMNDDGLMEKFVPNASIKDENEAENRQYHIEKALN